jgi:hypothetical protein
MSPLPANSKTVIALVRARKRQARLGIWFPFPRDFTIGGEGSPSTPFRMLRFILGKGLADNHNCTAKLYLAQP